MNEAPTPPEGGSTSLLLWCVPAILLAVVCIVVLVLQGNG